MSPINVTSPPTLVTLSSCDPPIHWLSNGRDHHHLTSNLLSKEPPFLKHASSFLSITTIAIWIQAILCAHAEFSHSQHHAIHCQSLPPLFPSCYSHLQKKPTIDEPHPDIITALCHWIPNHFLHASKSPLFHLALVQQLEKIPLWHDHESRKEYLHVFQSIIPFLYRLQAILKKKEEEIKRNLGYLINWLHRCLIPSILII